MSNQSSSDADKKRLQRINNMLKNEQPSEDDLLNHLAGTQPRPDAAFVNTLEARLMQQIQDTQADSHSINTDKSTPIHEEHNRMTHIQKKQPQSTGYTLPLTLLAAVLAIVVAGGLLLIINAPPPSGTPLAGGVILPEQQDTESDNVMIATSTPASVEDMPTGFIRGANPVNLREGPGLDFDVIGVVEPGTEFLVIDRDTDPEWYQIQFDGSSTGWIVASLVADADRTQRSSDNENILTTGFTRGTGSVNLWQGPGVDFDVIGVIEPGTDVLVIGSDEDQKWYQVQLDDATKGWVPATLIALAEWTGTGDVSPMIDVQQTATALMVTMTPTPGTEATTRPNLSADDCPASLDNVVYITLYETETWFRLSRQFDVPVDDLLALNCLERAQPLQRGDEVIMPADVIVRPVASQTLVIAAQNIPLGTIITEDMLYTTTTDKTTFERIQQTAGSPLRQNLADVIGQQARTLIQQNQPLELAAIGTPVECSTDTVSSMDSCRLLPDNRVAVTIPAHAVAHWLPGSPMPGQRVDVLQIEQQTTPDDRPAFVFNRVALNAQVLIEAEPSIVTLAVTPEQALIFTRLIENTETDALETFILIPHEN